MGKLQDLAWDRLDPRLDAVVAPAGTVEQVSAGHTWIEGLVPGPAAWVPLLLGHPAQRGLAVVTRAGHDDVPRAQRGPGSAPFAGREPGSNGLAVDAGGRLWLCQHGDRRIVRREADGTFVGIVERFEGKRLNSPNDLLLMPNGDLYFTDPPFGLPGQFDDPTRELSNT